MFNTNLLKNNTYTDKRAEKLPARSAHPKPILDGDYLQGSKQRVFGEEPLVCIHCKKLFWDNYQLSTYRSLHCPYCGSSHYTESQNL